MTIVKLNATPKGLPVVTSVVLEEAAVRLADKYLLLLYVMIIYVNCSCKSMSSTLRTSSVLQSRRASPFST